MKEETQQFFLTELEELEVYTEEVHRSKELYITIKFNIALIENNLVLNRQRCF